MIRLEREVDRLIAAENRRFLADEQAVFEAQQDGIRMREQMGGWLVLTLEGYREEHDEGLHSGLRLARCPECSRQR